MLCDAGFRCYILDLVRYAVKIYNLTTLAKCCFVLHAPAQMLVVPGIIAEILAAIAPFSLQSTTPYSGGTSPPLFPTSGPHW